MPVIRTLNAVPDDVLITGIHCIYKRVRVAKENFHTFPKKGVKMFIITYDGTNIDIH